MRVRRIVHSQGFQMVSKKFSWVESDVELQSDRPQVLLVPSLHQVHIDFLARLTIRILAAHMAFNNLQMCKGKVTKNSVLNANTALQFFRKTLTKRDIDYLTPHFLLSSDSMASIAMKGELTSQAVVST